MPGEEKNTKNVSEKASAKNPKNFRIIPIHLFSGSKMITLIVLAVVFIIAFPIISSITGGNVGRVVGTAVGSFQALTEDMPVAYSQGVQAGLNAEDVRLDYQNRIREIGELSVLAANAEITDVLKVGNKYEGLYTFGADVIFTVDITQATVYQAENKLIIKLPEPVGKINIDSTKTRLEDEWQRTLFNGSTENGITAYINSLKNIQNSTEESLKEYDQLKKQAEDSTIKQVAMITEMVVGSDKQVEIEFEGKAGESK